MCLYFSVANVQLGPDIVIVHPGQDVELLCNVIGGTALRVNGTAFTLAQLFNSELTGHNISGGI